MPEVGRALKRKSWECENESACADSVWVSSSSSGPHPKRKKQQNTGKCSTGKDVGDCKLFERDPFRSTTSCAAGKGKLRCVFPEEVAVPSSNSHDENNCVSKLRREAIECLTVKDEERTGPKDLRPALNSLDTVRTCMETLLGELREARTRMLQWMREEMVSLLHKAPGTPRACPASPGDISRENMDLEEQVRQLDSALTGSQSVNLLGAQFGGDLNRRNELGFSSQSGEEVIRGGLESGVESNDGSGGLESCDQNSVPGDSAARMNDSGDVREDISVSKQNMVSDQRILAALACQNSAHRDIGVSPCNGRFGNNIEETGQLSVPSVGYRADALSDFQTHNEQGRIEFSLQNDMCRDHGEHNFQTQSDICGGLGFGVESGNNGALGYGSSGDGGPQLHFGLHCGSQIGDFGGSLGLNNRGLENHRAMQCRVSNEDKAPDFVGLQSQVEAAELQNAGTMNMVWNMMQQRGRNLNQRACGPGGGLSATTVGNGITYDNIGLVRSATMQNAVSVPIRSASHCFTSVDLPTLITLQNQVALQSPSSLQNFLDLNVGLGIHKQMFPSVYLQESEVSISPNLGLVLKRGSGLLSSDMLELNT